MTRKRSTARAVHPVADLFPMLADDELAELAEDIKARGLLHPAVLDGDGRVLDGRNRIAACELAGVEPTFITYDGGDPDGYALAANGQRRSQTRAQKALIAAQALLLSNKTQEEIGSALGVSQPLVSQAKTIMAYARDLGEQILHSRNGAGFAEAREVAAGRKAEADRVESDTARLRTDAPDLLALVDEERMGLADAVAALDAREEKARQEAEVVASEQERERQRVEQEHRDGVSRSANRLRNFLDGYDTAAHLTRNPSREDVLAALIDYDRERYLTIEKGISWPSTLS